ncbi:MAG: mechanosensitive ion channel [Lachnospiraceae bacterium]|nr:mechanosensitive ion channel [Lachnospiraceae bacterium]
MAKFIKKRLFFLLALEIIALVTLYYILSTVQIIIATNIYEKDLTSKLEATERALSESWVYMENSYDNFININKSKAQMAAYYIKNDENMLIGNRSMKRLMNILNVDNVIVINKNGNLVTSAETPDIDFTQSDFDSIRTTFKTHLPSEPITYSESDDAPTLAYFGMYINDELELILEQNTQTLEETNRNTTSWRVILKRNTFGLDGITFSVSKDLNRFLYHPDDEIMKQSPRSLGITYGDLSSSDCFNLILNGKTYLCKAKYLKKDEAYVVCTIDEYNIKNDVQASVRAVVFFLSILISLEIIYTSMILRDESELNGTLFNDYRSLIKKLWGLFLLSTILIAVASFFIQSLFTYTMQLSSSKQEIENLSETISSSQEEGYSISGNFSDDYITKSLITADYIANNPGKINKDTLIELRNLLSVEHVLVYDSHGMMTMSDSTYRGMPLPDGKLYPGFDFTRLLGGIQFYMASDDYDSSYLEAPYLYVGSPIIDSNNRIKGVILLATEYSTYETATGMVALDSVLRTFNGTNDSFAFAINKESREFVYHPDATYVGKLASDYGIEDNELRDGYSGYITVNNQRFFCECKECDEIWLYIVVSSDKLYNMSVPLIIYTFIISFAPYLFFFILIILMCKFTKNHPVENTLFEGSSSDPSENTGNSEGEKEYGTAFIRRRISDLIKENPAEDRLKKYLLFSYLLCCVAITVMTLFKNYLFKEDSVIFYILDNKWEAGINIFSVISCVFVAARISLAALLISALLKEIGKTLGQRGETICKMLRSFVSYISVLGLIFSCLGMLGVQAGTLLASAGILTAVIGFGAQKLIGDVLEGLFIIFEGIFHVGDMVKIGDYRGIIQEIGIRTTKILDLDHNNIKVYNNTSLGSVEQLSGRLSYCDVVI